MFIKLIDEAPVLSAMEKVRSVFPNAMHVERTSSGLMDRCKRYEVKRRSELSDVELFKAFYKEVKGYEATEETEEIFKAVLDDLLKIENETMEAKNRQRLQINIGRS